MARRKTTEEFIRESINIHGKRYDYSKVNYKNCSTKVEIICKIHGIFLQTPDRHIYGKCGCPKCAIEKNSEAKRTTTQTFIEKAKEIHSDEYDYSQTVYGKNNLDKVTVICRKHGIFKITPSNHLSGQGCPKCRYEKSGRNNSLQLEEFIKRANNIHNNKYDYRETNYISLKEMITVICPIHGSFTTTSETHLSGIGCNKCWRAKLSEMHLSNTEEFIEKAKKIYNGLFDFSNVTYTDENTPVKVSCYEHGIFLSTPKRIIAGRLTCPNCSKSVLETNIESLLNDYGIRYERQKRFLWLGLQSLDFYLPEYKIGIECQGKQHFKAIDYFGGNDEFLKTVERDKKKMQRCIENEVKLLYFSNLGIDYPYSVFENKEKLISEILSSKKKK